jgi:hypothetical protein
VTERRRFAPHPACVEKDRRIKAKYEEMLRRRSMQLMLWLIEEILGP